MRNASARTTWAEVGQILVFEDLTFEFLTSLPGVTLAATPYPPPAAFQSFVPPFRIERRIRHPKREAGLLKGPLFLFPSLNLGLSS